MRLSPMLEDQPTVNESGFVGSFERFYAETWQTVYRAPYIALDATGREKDRFVTQFGFAPRCPGDAGLKDHLP